MPGTAAGAPKRAWLAERRPREESCGFVDESYGPARALRAAWTRRWTTLAHRPPPCPRSRASRPQAPQEPQPVRGNRTTLVLQNRTGLFVANTPGAGNVRPGDPPLRRSDEWDGANRSRCRVFRATATAESKPVSCRPARSGRCRPAGSARLLGARSFGAQSRRHTGGGCGFWERGASRPQAGRRPTIWRSRRDARVPPGHAVPKVSVAPLRP